MAALPASVLALQMILYTMARAAFPKCKQDFTMPHKTILVLLAVLRIKPRLLTHAHEVPQELLLVSDLHAPHPLSAGSLHSKPPSISRTHCTSPRIALCFCFLCSCPMCCRARVLLYYISYHIKYYILYYYILLYICYVCYTTLYILLYYVITFVCLFSLPHTTCLYDD